MDHWLSSNYTLNKAGLGDLIFILGWNGELVVVGVFSRVLSVIFSCGSCQWEDKSKVLQLIWNIILTFLAEAESTNVVLADYDIGPCCL